MHSYMLQVYVVHMQMAKGSETTTSRKAFTNDMHYSLHPFITSKVLAWKMFIKQMPFTEVEKTPASPLPIIDFCLALDENKFFLLISKS